MSSKTYLSHTEKSRIVKIIKRYKRWGLNPHWPKSSVSHPLIRDNEIDKYLVKEEVYWLGIPESKRKDMEAFYNLVWENLIER